jgi:hypothetical protein
MEVPPGWFPVCQSEGVVQPVSADGQPGQVVVVGGPLFPDVPVGT